MKMRALSIRQPWAWLILHGGKSVENRSWPLNHERRGPVLIHASKGLTRAEYDDATGFALDVGQQQGRALLLPPFEQLERGGIVGAARITRQLLPHDGGLDPWHIPGAYGFVLEAVTPLPFRPLKGALGLFWVDLTPAEADALRAARLAA